MARRLDPGEIETDNLIAEIERRITVEYRQAEREIAKKVEDYYKKYDIKLETWERWVREGKRKQEDFEQWRLGQIAVGRRWEDLRDQLAHDLHNTDQIARSIARGYMPEVYALNHNYGTFECEKGSGIDTSYTLYSRETVENMFRDNPQMLPEPGARVSRKIAEGKAIRWNEKNIQSVMTQAVLQGNNISDIATRLHNAMGPSFTEDDIKDAHKKDAKQIASELARKNRQAAIRNARTMATGAQNRGRQDAYRRAQAKGIETRQMWLAAHDIRTRHAHRQLDYVEKDLDEPFENELGKIWYPGDPTADPANVWSCRCCLRAIVAGAERRSGTSGDQDASQMDGMDYETWKASRVEKPKPILRPDQRQDQARGDWIRAYRERGGSVPSGRDMTLDIDARSAPSEVMMAPSQTRRTTGGTLANPTTLEDSMSPTAYDEMARGLRKAPESVANLYDTYGYIPGYVNTGRGADADAYYSPSDNLVVYNLHRDGDRNRFNNLHHELGHAFDHRMDGGVEGVTFDKFDALKEAVPAYRGYEVKPSRSDAFMAAMRDDADRIYDMLYAPNWREINSDLIDHDSSSGVQDFIDGLEQDKKRYGIVLTWGHGDEYYDRNFNRMSDADISSALSRLSGSDLAIEGRDDLKMTMREYETAGELWANIQAAMVVGGSEERYMRQFAPSSVNAFMDIVGRVK